MKLRSLAQMILGGYMIYDALSDKKAGMNEPACRNRVNCKGIKKNGRLRKGYQFVKGGAIRKV